MVTVDLFRLSRHDHMMGHVRILREKSSGQFHAIISYRDAESPFEDGTTSHRLRANSQKQAIEAALEWADAKFGGACLLLPLRHNFRHGTSAQAAAF